MGDAVSLARAILRRYPDASPEDFEIAQLVDGALVLERWSVTQDGEDVPQPTVAELATWADEEQTETATAFELPETPGQLVTYRALSENMTLPGGTTAVLQLDADLEGLEGYPVIIPHGGLYEVSLNLYATGGSTTLAKTSLEVTTPEGTSYPHVSESFFYSYIPMQHTRLVRFSRGDSLRALVGWASAQYPKQLLARRGDGPHLNTLLIRKVAA